MVIGIAFTAQWAVLRGNGVGHHPHEDDEDNNDCEPSLGSSGHGEAGAITYLVHAISDGTQMIYDCEGDEHDGREPDDDAEPSISGLTSDRSADATAMGV